MSEIVVSVREAADQQGLAMHEISRNMQEASAGSREVSSNISAAAV